MFKEKTTYKNIQKHQDCTAIIIFFLKERIWSPTRKPQPVFYCKKMLVTKESYTPNSKCSIQT